MKRVMFSFDFMKDLGHLSHILMLKPFKSLERLVSLSLIASDGTRHLRAVGLT